MKLDKGSNKKDILSHLQDVAPAGLDVSADIFGAALQNINWQEIAISMVDEYIEEQNYLEANS